MVRTNPPQNLDHGTEKYQDVMTLHRVFCRLKTWFDPGEIWIKKSRRLRLQDQLGLENCKSWTTGIRHQCCCCWKFNHRSSQVSIWAFICNLHACLIISFCENQTQTVRNNFLVCRRNSRLSTLMAGLKPLVLRVAITPEYFANKLRRGCVYHTLLLSAKLRRKNGFLSCRMQAAVQS